ncbi:hypothetical protein F0562_018726 [Nyssa sinensis]|uniref:Uncharacterized protein n=1 Tax=Nyssa sinensis TaxID=561372 RepID=A0A5J4ZA46_9ASTE|nr:hypothetical protein F0562_018726 [Nyssa sinensis]
MPAVNLASKTKYNVCFSYCCCIHLHMNINSSDAEIMAMLSISLPTLLSHRFPLQPARCHYLIDYQALELMQCAHRLTLSSYFLLMLGLLLHHGPP